MIGGGGHYYRGGGHYYRGGGHDWRRRRTLLQRGRTIVWNIDNHNVVIGVTTVVTILTDAVGDYYSIDI